MLLATNENSAIFVWSLILIGVSLLGFLAVVWVRRRLYRTEESPPLGFSLEDLREMQRKGQLSAEEYERARTRLVAGMLKRQEQKPAK